MVLIGGSVIGADRFGMRQCQMKDGFRLPVRSASNSEPIYEPLKRAPRLSSDSLNISNILPASAITSMLVS